MSDKNLPYNHLYDISIDTIDFSDKARIAMLRTGITSIGDILDCYLRGNNAMDGVSIRLIPFLYDEIEEKIKAYGYWQYAEEDK